MEGHAPSWPPLVQIMGQIENRRARAKFLKAIWPELLLGALLGCAYLLTVPLWEAPDETAHFGNILYVRKHGAYKLTYGDAGLYGMFKGETTQPPPFYFVASLLTEPWATPSEVKIEPVENAACRDDPWRFRNRGAQAWPRMIRGVSLLFLLLTGLVTAAAARVACKNDRHFPATVMSMMWAVPQMMFCGAAISNDAFAMAAGACLLYVWLRLHPASRRWKLLLIGLVGVAAILAKFTLVPLYAAGLLLVVIQARSSWGRRILDVVSYLLPALAGLGMLWIIRPEMIRSLILMLGQRVLYPLPHVDSLVALSLAWESYWGRFGWMNVSAPPWMKEIFFTLSIALTIGVAHAWVRRREWRWAITCGAMLAGTTIIATGLDIRSSAQAQGRHLFSAIGAFSLLGAFAIRAYMSSRRARQMTAALALLLNGYVLCLLLPSAYGQSPPDLLLGTACCHGQVPTPILEPGAPEKQQFVSAMPMLSRVGVVPATFGLPVRGTARLSLLEVWTGHCLAVRVIDAGEIEDGRYLYLDFPPLDDSENQAYIIKMEVLEKFKGQVALFWNPLAPCEGAERLTGSGDLRFVTYHHEVEEGG